MEDIMTKALVILCGGQSTRMGSDKTFLPFGSGSLLNYQIERFRPFFSKIYLSVPALEDRNIAYEKYCNDCTIIRDQFSQIGPIGGLYSCLSSAPEEILFFTPVDAPFTDPSLASEICNRLEQNPGKEICTIQNPQGRIQPLFTAYRKTCLDRIKLQITHGIYKLQPLLAPEYTIVIDKFLPSSQFFNMNDPQSYYYALEKLSHETPAAFPPGFASQNSGSSKEKPALPMLSFTAKSGTGKTTYLEKLIPMLKVNGLRIAVIKHDAHGFQMDKPGKDSYRLTQAGADHMILTSEDQTAVIITHPKMPPELDELIARTENVDLILTEGYKLEDQPKVVLLRKGYCETPVGNPKNVIAYVADFPYGAKVPVFDLNHPEDILDFLLDYIRTNEN